LTQPGEISVMITSPPRESSPGLVV